MHRRAAFAAACLMALAAVGAPAQAQPYPGFYGYPGYRPYYPYSPRFFYGPRFAYGFPYGYPYRFAYPFRHGYGPGFYGYRYR